MSVQDLLPELADPRGEYVDVSDVSDSDSDATQEWEPTMVNAQRAGKCDCPANVASSKWHPSLPAYNCHPPPAQLVGQTVRHGHVTCRS